MWFLYLLTSLLALTAAYLTTSIIISSRRALEEYKKKSLGLPMLPNPRAFMANHGAEFHLGRNICNKITKWHETHGKTFGFLYGTRPCASTIDLDLIKLFIVDEPQLHVNRMPFNSPFIELERDGIFLLEGEQWRRIRRAFGPAIRKFKLPSVISDIEESCQKFADSVETKLTSFKEGQVDIEVYNFTHRYSIDLVLRCLFKQKNMIDYNTDECHWVDIGDEGLRGPMELAFLTKLCLVFPKLVPLLDWMIKKFTSVGEWHGKIVGFIEDQIEQAIMARDQLIEMRKGRSSDSFDPDNFTLTNDKTVADVMTHSLYLLAVTQEVQTKLRESIQSKGMDSLYLMWVINETLRLHPPATIGCSRTISRDIKLAEGYTLPAGTYVHAPLYTIHRHKAYWGEDATEFKPERWQRADEFHPMQFIPFGAGIRSCPGKGLAIFEIKKLLTTLLTRYKLECKRKDDICLFDSPYTIYVLPHSETFVKFSKL